MAPFFKFMLLGLLSLGAEARKCSSVLPRSSVTTSSTAVAASSTISSAASVPTTFSTSSVIVSTSSSTSSSVAAGPTACTSSSQFYLSVSGGGRDNMWVAGFTRSRSSPSGQPNTESLQFSSTFASATKFRIDANGYLYDVVSGTTLNIASSTPGSQVPYFNTPSTIPSGTYQPTVSLGSGQQLLVQTANAVSYWLGTTSLTSSSAGQVYVGNSQSSYTTVIFTAVCY